MQALGAVLTTMQSSTPSRSDTASVFCLPDFLFDKVKATTTCRFCGAVLEPTPFELKGQQAWAPKQCACEEAHRERRTAELAALAQEKKAATYKRAFPPDDMGDMQRAVIDSFTARDGSENVLRFTRQYIAGLPHPNPPCLVMWGDVGNGKSHLAAAIANVARGGNMAVAWVHTPTWLRSLGAMDAGIRERNLEMATEADLLVLDELGGGKLTASRADWLLSVLDSRYRRKLPMVITTNKSLAELGKALTPVDGAGESDVPDGARLVDRLLEVSLVVENKATSYRQEMADQRIRKLTGSEG